MKLNKECGLFIDVDDTADMDCVFNTMLRVAKRLQVEVYGKYRDKEIYVLENDSLYRIKRRYAGKQDGNT